MANQHFTEMERKFASAERDINRFAEKLEDVTLQAETIKQLDKQKAERLAKMEKITKQRQEAEKKAKEAARLAKESEEQEYKAQQAKIAKQLNIAAKKKMAQSNSKTLQLTTMMKDVNDAHLEDRIEAVMELKANQDNVRAEVATLAEKHNRKIAAAKKRLEDEKESLLAKGLNPYVEFRKQEFAEEAAARERKLKAAVEKNKSDLASRMEREEYERSKQDAAKRAAYEYEKRHRDSQGRFVGEEKNREHIVALTSNHAEVLDPTGRVPRVDPSQITDVVDHSFGTGKTARIPPESMKRITEKIRQGLKVEREDLGEYDRFTKALRRDVGRRDGGAERDGDDFKMDGADDLGFASTGGAARSSRSAPASGEVVPNSSEDAMLHLGSSMDSTTLAQFEELAAPAGGMPGVDKAAVQVNLDGNEEQQQTLLRITVEESGTSAATGAAAELLSANSPKYKTTALSKFERDALNRAKDRHHDRIEYGTEQIAGGKLFQGDAFVSKPEQLVYVDFEVGKTYKKHFTLTNVSYTFNSFKILDLPDDCIDFFTVTFVKPGRMSAGMSCGLDIEFKPMVNKDINTHLRFLTQTGPIAVPLRCLIKRCAPRVAVREIDFGEVVTGQRIALPLKFTNTEALATRFTVTPIFEEKKKRGGSVLNSNGLQEVAPGDDGPASGDAPASAVGGGVNDAEQNEGESEGGALSGEAALMDIMGSEPALNEAELQSRVRRTLTLTRRQKQHENPSPICCCLRFKTADMVAAMNAQAAANNEPPPPPTVYPNEVVEGYLEGYGTAQVDIVCAPLAVGLAVQKFLITFENLTESNAGLSDTDPVVKEVMFEARVYGEEVPIYVEEETLDMKCTLYDRIYRRKIVLKNRAVTSYRVNIKIDPVFAPYVEVNPNLLFVQPLSSQTVNVCLRPTSQSSADLVHYSCFHEAYQNAALLLLPIEINAANQELPVYFVIKSNMTQSTIDLSSSQLNFGKIYVGQQSTRSITLTNTSMLAQKIAFVRLKKEFAVQPNDGFAVLLPNESMEFQISFSPTSAINYETEVTLMTSNNDSYHLKIIAQGVEAPITFSNAVVHMRTTAPGERVNESVLVTNTSNTAQIFEVVVPNKLYSWLTISPAAVNLAPGQTTRLEIDYVPPPNAAQLDPVQWHAELVQQSTQQQQSGDNNSIGQSPFDNWEFDSGWAFGRGTFGNIQWVKEGAGKPEAQEQEEEKAAGEATSGGAIAAANDEHKDDTASVGMESATGGGPETGDGAAAGDDAVSTADGRPPIYSDLAPQEWGVVGRWNFPVMLKSKRQQQLVLQADAASANSSPVKDGTIGAVTTRGGSPSKGVVSGDLSIPAPMFLSVTTAVMPPQIDADTKLLEFGQISVGTRQLKTFKIFNKNADSIKLKSVGLNAVGPFVLLRPVKVIAGGESTVVVVECLPTQPGLFVEVLELFCPEDEEAGTGGGHRIRVTMRVQGLMPSVQLSGLGAPPPSWSPRAGILDFGHVVAQDVVVKKFTIANKSTFSVDARISRVPGLGLPPAQQGALIERTASGLPIFSIKPERVQIPQGGAQEIEVTFRPDRGRFLPFREDVDVMIGETDEILRVGIFGRSWARQMLVCVADPRDDAVAQKRNAGGPASVEDTLLVSTAGTEVGKEIRASTMAARRNAGGQFPETPELLLEFPDPFNANADASLYEETDPNAAPLDPKAKPAKGAPAAPAGPPPGSRRQTKQLQISAARILDGRTGGAGSFEVVLSDAAKESGIWTLSTDKGAIPAPPAAGTPNSTSDVFIDVLCTQAKPRSLGGIFVGSWKSFPAEVVLKGGWVPTGDNDEVRVPIILKAYVSL